MEVHCEEALVERRALLQALETRIPYCTVQIQDVNVGLFATIFIPYTLVEC